jgi:RNA polymerase sigma factor (sigma-70 family)
MAKGGKVSPDEARSLLTRYRETGDVSLRNRVVEDSFDIVYRHGREHKGGSTIVDTGDLFGHLHVALIEAAERYDCTSRACFRTYATNRVRWAAADFWREFYSYPIRLPVYWGIEAKKRNRARIDATRPEAIEDATRPSLSALDKATLAEMLATIDPRDAAGLIRRADGCGYRIISEDIFGGMDQSHVYVRLGRALAKLQKRAAKLSC